MKLLTTAAILATSATAEFDLYHQKNIFGQPLKTCSTDPMTGYLRDGKCTMMSSDQGTHVVAAVMDQKFLDYTKAMGNDLSTPRAWGFPGLKPGDKWCLCQFRWKQAVDAGFGPKVDLDATNEHALTYLDINLLKEYAIDNDNDYRNSL